MLPLIKPKYLLLTDNKQSIYFDHWIKPSSKVCNAQCWYWRYFHKENEDFFLYQHLQEDKTVVVSKNKQKGNIKNKKQRLNFAQHFPQKILIYKK